LGSGTFRGQGFVVLDDGGQTSDTYPDPGPIANFAFFGASTFDPDPLYVAALHPPTTTRVDQIQVAAGTVAITSQSIIQPTINHTSFSTLNVNTFGGLDDVSVQLGAATLPTAININGGDPTTGDHVTVHGSSVADNLTLQATSITESVSGRVVTLSAVEK